MVAPLAACALGMQGMVLSNKATENPNAVLLMLFHEFAFNRSATPLGLCVVDQLRIPLQWERIPQKNCMFFSVTDWGQSGRLVGMPNLVTEET